MGVPILDLIEVGQIVNTHGIRGEVKINSWVDDLSEFEDFEEYFYKKSGEFVKLTPKTLRFHKNCAIVKFEEISDMTQAETFKGTVLFTEKSNNLPENVYYVGDLIGLSVVSEGKEIGKVTDVFKTGANDVYEVKTEDGKKGYIPAVSEFIKEIDMESGKIEVSLIDGMID